MENLVQIIRHEKFGEIRTLLIDEEFYFMGKDSAKSLGFKDTSKAIRTHVVEADKKLIKPADLIGLNLSTRLLPKGGAIFINESGLYSLVLASKLPFAAELKNWLMSEVMPEYKPAKFFDDILARGVKKFVYIFEMENDTVKIGITQDVNQRIKSIQSESGAKVLRRYNSKVIDAKLAAEIESKCHATFEEKRAHGEYFNITFEEGCTELDKYAEEIDAANAEIEKLINAPAVTPPQIETPQIQPPENDSASVYAFAMSDDTVKIGMSGNISDRLKTIERETLLKVIGIFSLKVDSRKKAFELETALHEYFSAQCTQGEFFNADFNEVCEQIKNLIVDEPAKDFSVADRLLKIAELTADKNLREECLKKAYDILN